MEFTALPSGLFFLIIFLLILAASAIRILREYERGVVFRLGRLIGAKGPGLVFIIPGIDKLMRISLRTVTMDIPAQDVIHAEGEYQAAEKLAQAADVISAQPAAVHLRFLQTMNEVATEKNSTIIFPIPIDLLRQFFQKK